MKRLVMDVDGTLTLGDSDDYATTGARTDVVERLRQYKAQGFEIVLYTSRNMRTHQNSLGKIVAHTVPVLTAWLDKHEIPYDEIWVGKPWCGHDGFYVDDRAVRPDEFLELGYDEIMTRIGAKGVGPK